jgi:hypothetical protein
LSANNFLFDAAPYGDGAFKRSLGVSGLGAPALTPQEAIMERAVMLDIAGTNGTVKAKPRRRASKPKASPTVGMGRGRRVLTVGLGCGIPGLSLSLSSIGGRLLEDGHTALGSSALALCTSVLAVSLSHLAWAVLDITGSARWQAWCLAVAVDLSLVLGELSRVQGFGLWLVPVVMGSVTVVSAVLNCWAFLRSER